ncbi:MAG TPA: DUF3285 domain-containing protein [Thermosynechococcaceae cyanobacterium]
METPNPEVELTLKTEQAEVSQAEAEQVTEAIESPTSTEPPPSYVKLAMRNMVKKRGTSLQHFFLTTFALLAGFIGLAYLTR